MLAARAQLLARPLVDADAESGESFVLFQVGEGRYGLAAPYVLEVQSVGDYTALPGVPPFVLGLVNLRGRLLTALDLRPLLDIPTAPPAATASWIMVQGPGFAVALLADAVLGVERRPADFLPSLGGATARSSSWVRGLDANFTVILDAAGLLSDPRLSINLAEG